MSENKIENYRYTGEWMLVGFLFGAIFGMVIGFLWCMVMIK